jgi:hypothetical protein
MGWPAHDPELYEELLKKAFLRNFEELFGTVPDEICQFVHDKENFYYWIDENIGWQYALKISQEAEADYWSGLIDEVMYKKEDILWQERAK